MNDLRKADLGTIKTFLIRNVTAEKLMSDLLTATSQNSSSISPRKAPRSATLAVDDDQLIPPPSVTTKLSSNPDAAIATAEIVDSEKVAKRRKMKNGRKKRKKLEKKAIKEHESTI